MFLGSRARAAIAGGMNEDFGRVLQVQMDYYSNNTNADKITKVQVNEIRVL